MELKLTHTERWSQPFVLAPTLQTSFNSLKELVSRSEDIPLIFETFCYSEYERGMTNKSLVVGIGNAIVDTLCNVEFSDLELLDLPIETLSLVTPDEQRSLAKKITHRKSVRRSGGSVANSLALLCELGGEGAFIGKVGSDEEGIIFTDDMLRSKVNLSLTTVPAGSTGSCLVLISPDGRRTMRTSLGCAGHLTIADTEIFSNAAKSWKDAAWVFIEGYLLVNGEDAVKSLYHAVEQAKQHSVKVALTASDAFVIKLARPALEELRTATDLLFCNQNEACELAHDSDVDAAIAKLAQQWKAVCVTLGSDGCVIADEGKVRLVKTEKIIPVDLTGAGDVFAGAVLYKLSQGDSLDSAVALANKMAGKVIQIVGARLPQEMLN